MIAKWKVFNFKSIREETELDLGLLTIFAGANSSGKSTFIQSILLVAQTLAHKVSSRSVVLNGAFTSLGQFDDLKSTGSESDQISIKCTCRPLPYSEEALKRGVGGFQKRALYYDLRSNSLREVACEISFDADASSSQRDLLQIQPRLFASQLTCISRDEDNVDQKAEISVRYSNKGLSEINGIDSIGDLNEQLRASLAYDVDIDDTSLAEVKEDFRSAHAIGCVLRHFLPEQIVYGIDTIQEDANTITLVLQSDGRHTVLGRRVRFRRDLYFSKDIVAVLRDVLRGTIDFDEAFKDEDHQQSLFSSDHEQMSPNVWQRCLHQLSRKDRVNVQQVLRETEDLYERILEALKTATISQEEAHNFAQIRPPAQISEASNYLDNFFASSLKYLGPLRDAPKPLYPLAPAADPHDVGLRGELTASILEMHKNKKIRYIPSSHFEKPTVDRKTVTRSLEAAVIDWLQYLGVASSVKSRDQGKLGHELKVELLNSDGAHDLTHVGVGVSQVLPILVMCLLAENDSTLVFEQPEMHLHPKVQTLLGDFFLSMALCDKQCIVETHSEYVIDRLRFRIAAATPGNELNDLTKIYFVEKPKQGSSFREVTINEYGAISNWPEGFFDQSQQQAEEILRAAAMKRKANRGKGGA